MTTAEPHFIQPKPPEKKPYGAPRLLVYGDIRSITQAMASGAAFDGQALLKTGGV